MPEAEERSSFPQDVKAIDPKVLAKAMGGTDVPPEENLFSTFEEGFGYFTSAAVGRSLKQYRLVRKLGWAANSSVWLALNQSAETTTFVALKILTSQATAQIVGGHSTEYDVFRKIKQTNPNSPGFNHCLTLQHCFIAKSEAGGHICFVTEALSSSLENFRVSGEDSTDRPLPLRIVKRITKQVLLALDYLHRECGYIHTDIKSENILLSIPEPRASRISQLLKEDPPAIYGPPLSLPSLKVPLVFSCSQPLPYFSLCDSVEDIEVRLVDYSEATPVDKPGREHLRQPNIIRAPEVTLRYPWTSAIDIWTVGCLVFELLTNRILLYQEHDAYSHEIHLQNIIEVLGPFPLDFLEECEDREKYFDEKGTLLHTKNTDFAPTTLENNLRKLTLELGDEDEDEILGTAKFLRRCLMLDPRMRPSAQELLEDGWLSL